jgi:hypothetical protein
VTHQLPVNLSDEQYAWVQDQARTRQGDPQASVGALVNDVITELVDAAMSAE